MGRTRLEATLVELDTIVEETRSGHSELGIFPSMYRSVTSEIRDALRSGFFDDEVAMENLAVAFAERYIDAYRQWTRSRKVPESWRVAFDAATDGRKRMVAQHLLAGMNAHINLDLGIVAAEVAGDEPDGLHNDFLRVNEVLFQKLNGLQDCLGSVSSRMVWVDRLGGTLDERLMRLAIGNARNEAWALAQALIRDPAHSEAIIDTRDRETADLGRGILGGSLPVRILSGFVAKSEPTDVGRVLDAFSGIRIDLGAVERSVAAAEASGKA